MDKPSSYGIGFIDLLTLLFIGLKLGHVISWSWWWVLSPLWISASIIVGLLILTVVVLCLKEYLGSR